MSRRPASSLDGPKLRVRSRHTHRKRPSKHLTSGSTDPTRGSAADTPATSARRATVPLAPRLPASARRTRPAGPQPTHPPQAPVEQPGPSRRDSPHPLDGPDPRVRSRHTPPQAPVDQPCPRAAPSRIRSTDPTRGSPAGAPTVSARRSISPRARRTRPAGPQPTHPPQAPVEQPWLHAATPRIRSTDPTCGSAADAPTTSDRRATVPLTPRLPASVPRTRPAGPQPTHQPQAPVEQDQLPFGGQKMRVEDRRTRSTRPPSGRTATLLLRSTSADAMNGCRARTRAPHHAPAEQPGGRAPHPRCRRVSRRPAGACPLRTP